MSKWITRDARNGQFVIGRRSAEKFSAVEGLHPSARTGRLVQAADRNNEAGEQRRARIRSEFSKK